MIDEAIICKDGLGDEFIPRLQHCIEQTETALGRHELGKLLKNTLTSRTKRGAIAADHRSMLCLNALCIYSAYLLSVRDGDHDMAYEILFRIESLNRSKVQYLDPTNINNINDDINNNNYVPHSTNKNYINDTKSYEEKYEENAYKINQRKRVFRQERDAVDDYI